MAQLLLAQEGTGPAQPPAQALPACHPHCAAGVTSSHGAMHREETRSYKNDFKNKAKVSTELFKLIEDVKAYDTVKKEQ